VLKNVINLFLFNAGLYRNIKLKTRRKNPLESQQMFYFTYIVYFKEATFRHYVVVK